MRPVRWIDAGRVSGLRSQALYHGLARAFDEGTPDTIIVATPAERYMCVGLHQDMGETVDLEWCGGQGIQVLRREVGGGAVLIDEGQVFLQWIMAPESLPARVERRFEEFARPVVAAYAEIGIDAAFRPPNDIHVGDRKICGTGAGRIGDAEVVVGNFLFDFDMATFARALNVTATLREEVGRSLERYMTTVRRELGFLPDREGLLETYRRKCGAVLGRPVETGRLTEGEESAVRDAERRLASADFLGLPGARVRPGVRIHQDVSVREVTGRSGSASLLITARLRQARIEEIRVLVQDRQRTPRRDRALEAALCGVELEREAVDRALLAYDRARTAGTDLDGIMAAILQFRT